MAKNKNKTDVFEKATVPKAVASLAIPSMLGMLVNVIYNMADTFFVGQTKDSNQVAAVSVTMPVFLLLIACGNIFGVGGCSFISRSLGEGKTERVKSISAFCVFSSIATGFIMMALMLIGCADFTGGFLLKAIGCSPNTWDFAKDYLKYIAIGAPFVVVAVMAGSVVRGEGAAKESMIGMMIGTITNIILDPVMITVMKMGVAGAAIATVIGNIASVLYFLIYFLRGKSILSISPKRFTLKQGIPKNVIFIGAPASFNNLLMSISNIIINNVLVAYGDAPVAAMGVAMKANMLVIMIQMGLAQGIQPLIGYCYGARNPRRLKKSLSFSAMCNIIIGTVLGVLCIVFAKGIVRVFINDEEVIKYGVLMLRALASVGPFIGIMFVLNFSFQGMGKALHSMILSVGRQGLIYIPLLFILNKAIGLEGAIWAQPVADGVCFIMSVVMFMLINKELKKMESPLKSGTEEDYAD